MLLTLFIQPPVGDWREAYPACTDAYCVALPYVQAPLCDPDVPLKDCFMTIQETGNE